MQILGLCYIVTIKKNGTIKIGCQVHTTENWKSFSLEALAGMDSRAKEFAIQYRDIIIAAAESFQSMNS